MDDQTSKLRSHELRLVRWALSVTEPEALDEAHPTDEVFEAVAEGTADESIRDAYFDHAANCSECRMRLSALWRDRQD